MPISLTAGEVWKAIEKELFCVLGMVNSRGEARSVGVVYAVRDRRLYVGTGRDTWKTRHVQANPHVSITVPIAKRIPFIPWARIPAATITASGTARVLDTGEAPPGVVAAIFRGVKQDGPTLMTELCILEITLHGDFLTYGVGVPMITMRKPEEARGRAPV